LNANAVVQLPEFSIIRQSLLMVGHFNTICNR